MKKDLLKDFVLLSFFIAVGCFVCLKLGQDANWDLTSYHYYSVWAALNDRLGFDIMPCGIQSYFNPLIDMPLYFLIKFFNDKPCLISMLLSFPYGFCVFWAYKIAQLVFNGKYKKQLVAFSVIIGATGTLSVFNIGACFGDLFIASFALLAIFIFLKNIFLADSKKRSFLIFLAALLIGLSAGLKTNGIMLAVGIVGVEILLCFKFKNPVKIILLTLSGIFLGTLITGGWWYYTVYQYFGNPFFPFNNDAYKSPLAAEMSFLDARHLPKSALQSIFYPIFWTFGNQGNPVVDFESFDIRWVLVYFSVIIFVLGISFDAFKQKIQNIINYDITCILTAAIVINYVIWLNSSSTLRYLQHVEFLSGIFILMVAYTVLAFFKIKQSRVFIILGCILSMFIIISTRHVDSTFTRTEPREKFLDFENFNLPDDSVLLYVGGFPAAIYMPFQNPNSRFVYLFGEMGGYHFVYGQKYVDEINKIIKNAGDKVYVVYSDFDPALKMWKNNGVIDLNKDDFKCREVNNNFNQPYYVCSLKEGKKVITKE